MKPTLPPPPSLQPILDWLAQLREVSPAAELAPMAEHLATLKHIDLPVLHRLKIVELFQQRIEQLDEALKPRLLDVRLPLPGSVFALARALIDTRTELGDAWVRIVEEAEPHTLERVRRSVAQISLHGVRNLHQQLVATHLIALPIPLRLWRNVQTLYHAAVDALDLTATLPAEMTFAETHLKSMLALATSQPEGLSPREIAFLSDYIDTHATAVRIDTERPDEDADGFWMAASLDQPPMALARREPESGRCLYFRCGDLAALTGTHVKQLGDGIPPAALGLAMHAAGADYRNALERARLCWSAPRRRSFSRRESALRVEVCTQLSTLWQLLDGGEAIHDIHDELTTSDWTVLNEGPAGYAMIHVGGRISGLLPGGAIGLRLHQAAEWQICLVRWARSQGSDHVELGLEVMAPSAQAIRLQPHACRTPSTPVPALLLPPLPHLNRGEAILAARGDYNARPFTLLLETDGRLQVVECMPRHTLVETASIEIFEFVREARAV